MRRLASTLWLLATIAALTPAQNQLTTNFNGGARWNPGACNLFDLQLNVGITIAAFDISLETAGSGTIDVYVAPGSYVGNELNPSAWTLVGNAPFTAAAPRTPTPAPLTAPIALAAGNVGVAICFNGQGPSYSSGANTYSNAEMTLTTGATTRGTFATGIFTPRTWNGTIYYNIGGGGGGGFATATPYGTGCGGGGPPGFYELFTATSNPFDMSGTPPGSTGVTMNAAGSIYVVTIGSGLWFTPTSPGIPFSDDQTQQITLPWALPYQGGLTNDLWVCSNGWIAFESTTSATFTESVSGLLTGPARLALYWDDLNPANGGSIHFDQDPVNPGIVYVTWVGVPEYSNTGANTFQAAIYQGGSIELRYQTVSSLDSLVGFSPGNGAGDPGGVDISAIQAIPLGDGRNPLELGTQSGSRPVIGGTFTMEVSEIPAGTALGALLFSFNQVNPGVSLASMGINGCDRYIDLDGSLILGMTAPSTQIPLTIPNSPGVAGLHIYYQAAAFSSGFNPLGVIVTGGLDAKFDVQ